MTTCPSEEQLATYVAGEQSENQTQRIRTHIQRCERCQLWLQEARADEDALVNVRRVLADPDIIENRLKAGSSISPLAIDGYQILSEIKRGGQGVVFRAVQKSTKRNVAIKVLLEGGYAPAAATLRFQREIHLLAELKHPNIIAIFDAGLTTTGQPYLVMDYVDGLPLHAYARQHGLKLEETLNLFSVVCEAVQSAHQHGIIHRDLKPSNILVDSTGQPRILDFGLAKKTETRIESLVSASHQVLGTLPYMSPEQVRGEGESVDTRTDIYALGVILYELLTGNYPYPVVGQLADVLNHIAGTPPTPPSKSWTPESGVRQRTDRRRRPGQCPIDEDVQTIILKALSKERERRYQSAGEFARDVGHCLKGEAIEARRDSGWYHLKKFAYRYRVQMFVAVAIVLSLFIAVIISTTMYIRATRAQMKEAEQRARAEL